jgi:hypothetical protein
MIKILNFFKNFNLMTGRKQTCYVDSRTILGCGVVYMKTEEAKKVFIESKFPIRPLGNGKEGFYSVFGTVL